MPPERERRPATEVPSAAPDRSDLSICASPQATSGGPSWYLHARPLRTCHDHVEFAIACPDGDHEALAWRSRPGERGSGWACPFGHRGQLWQLLGAAS